ncbi:MAG: PhoH family protein [Bacteroidales bacterium]|jgi:PhoH-like ATPase|nr:PhoH family protein [Bacteroidales bacterium]
MAKKNFVLDTNVILHDYKCLDNFQENDVYIPLIVLEELDKFKKGSDQINYNAREFVRHLDSVTDDNLFSKGTSLGEEKGRLFVVARSGYNELLEKAFAERSPDNRILSVALNLKEKQPTVKTVLISKDINLRMKARSLGVVAEDYINDKVLGVDIFEKAHEVFDNIDQATIDRLYSNRTGIPVEEFELPQQLTPNDCFVLNGLNASVLARYNPFTRMITRVIKERNYGIEPRNAEQSFAFEILNDTEIKLVGLTGKAGTGKTLLALASALRQSDLYKQILLARPIVSLANKDIGFLPGDEKQKIAPYMQPLFDNLTVIKNQLNPNGTEIKRIDEMQKSGHLVIEALAFIRGRSLSETFCIIDEAQNLTPHEIKTIITRAGEGTKMVFTGDMQQIDSPYLDSQSNGLAYMIDKMKGQNIFAHANLVKGERSLLSELASGLL